MRPRFLSRPRRPQTLPEAASAFMRREDPAQPAELGDLLEHAHAYLEARFPRIRRADIEAAALAAWAQAEGERTRCHVDLEASTPYLLWLVDPVAGVRRPFPVADLVRLLGPRTTAA